MRHKTYPLLITKVGPNKCQWDRDTKPQGQQGYQGREGNGSTASLSPQNQIQKEEHPKHNPGTNQRDYSQLLNNIHILLKILLLCLVNFQ